ncbi:DUF3987 domain-containing protein [Marinivivus vitaminiproducens]|uniref:DUF3987 domain-containing protein n=1 Tax=Marinivivus vitaminiproducens TaxID=3035935 RepID=UPI0027A19AE1|nr:DUF3987 domain-containing protein [Geminicoccaceae bacterium SCSIO 64248]
MSAPERHNWDDLGSDPLDAFLQHPPDRDHREHPSEASSGWDAPDTTLVSFQRKPAPLFPIEVTGPWGDWIAVRAECAGAPADYLVWAMLAAIGAAIANVRWVTPWNGWKEPPVLNVGLVGLPSSGKSPALDVVTSVLRDAEARLGAGHESERQEWEERAEAARAAAKEWKKDLAKAVRDGEQPPRRPDTLNVGDEPRRLRMFTTDATMEAAAALMQANERGLLLARDELAGWIGSLDKYGGNGAERPFWIEAFGGRAKVVDRVKYEGKELYIPRLSIGIIGGIQPDRLSTLLLTGDDDGLASRFIFVWPEPAPLVRPTRFRNDGPLTEALYRLRQLHRIDSPDGGEARPVLMPLSASAVDVLQDFRERNRALEASTAGLFLSHVGKWPGIVLRVALLLEHLWWAWDRQASRQPNEVSEQAAVAAIRVIEEYIHPMALRIYGEASLPKVERDAVTVARWIRERLRRDGHLVSFTTRDMQRARLPGLATASDVRAALEELQEASWIRRAPSLSGLGHRPKEVWLVSPLLSDALEIRIEPT